MSFSVPNRVGVSLPWTEGLISFQSAVISNYLEKRTMDKISEKILVSIFRVQIAYVK
jgi:hypothetical protein